MTPAARSFPIRKKLYQCPSCRDLLDIVYDFSRTDVDSLKESFSLRRLSNRPLDVSGVWRYRELLPFEAGDLDRVVTMGEGNNPILDAPRCAEYVGLDRLRVKNLGWNPSGSFKDYGMTVAVSQAIRLGAQVVACASTGNHVGLPWPPIAPGRACGPSFSFPRGRSRSASWPRRWTTAP